MIACPECGSTDVEELEGTGLLECVDCLECFDEFEADEDDIADAGDYY